MPRSREGHLVMFRNGTYLDGSYLDGSHLNNTCSDGTRFDATIIDDLCFFDNIVASPTYISDDEPLPRSMDNCIVSQHYFIQLAQARKPMPAAVALSPTDNVLLLKPLLSQLKLICIDFPVFTDGRGNTQARLLTKRLGFTGDIRAIGDVRADQMLFMARAGFTSFSFDSQPDHQLIASLLKQYPYSYQSSYSTSPKQYKSKKRTQKLGMKIRMVIHSKCLSA